MADLQAQVEELWERRAELAVADGDALPVVREAIGLLDSGEARVAEIDDDGEVVVHQWLKQAILLYFKCSAMQTIELNPFEYVDKVPLKQVAAWEEQFLRYMHEQRSQVVAALKKERKMTKEVMEQLNQAVEAFQPQFKAQ